MSERRRTVPSLPALLASLAVLLTVPLVMGFWGGIHPAFDSFAHFRVHLAALIIVLALPALFTRGWRLIGGATIMLGVMAVVSVLLPQGSDAATATQENSVRQARYSLLQLNLRYDNAKPREVLSLIGRVQPDVITLDEVSEQWTPWLKLTEAAYPYRIVCPPPSPIGGVAVLSRRPFARSRRAACFDRGAMAVARVQFGGRAVNVVALHLGWPWPFSQPGQVRSIAPVLAGVPGPAILAGDFNATPWSATARHVAEEGRMRILRGIGPTWLARPLPDVLRRLIGLPIDNVLVKGGIAPMRPERLTSVGSDHLPVLVKFAFEPDGEEPPKVEFVQREATSFQPAVAMAR